MSRDWHLSSHKRGIHFQVSEAEYQKILAKAGDQSVAQWAKDQVLDAALSATKEQTRA